MVDQMVSRSFILIRVLSAGTWRNRFRERASSRQSRKEERCNVTVIATVFFYSSYVFRSKRHRTFSAERANERHRCFLEVSLCLEHLKHSGVIFVAAEGYRERIPSQSSREFYFAVTAEWYAQFRIIRVQLLFPRVSLTSSTTSVFLSNRIFFVAAFPSPGNFAAKPTMPAAPNERFSRIRMQSNAVGKSKELHLSHRSESESDSFIETGSY